MKSWTSPGDGFFKPQPLSESNDVELMDIEKKDWPKFKKEFEKVSKRMSGLKPEYGEPGGMFGPYGSLYVGGMSSGRKKQIIKAIEDTLKKLKIKSYDLRRNPMANAD